MKFLINTDGGARGNPGPAASAAVIKNEQGECIAELNNYLGATTNNVAEYQGVLLAFDWLTKHVSPPNNADLSFYLDSLLVVSQLKGEYKIKNSALKQLALRIESYQKFFKTVTYTYVPREQNAAADKLVNKALDENKNA